MSKTNPIEFSLSLDGRLSEDAQREFEDRLNSDPELRTHFEHFKTSRNVVRASNRLKVLPPGFDHRLRKRLHSAQLEQSALERAQSELGKSSWWSRVSLAVSGMAAGVVFMLGLNVFLVSDNTNGFADSGEALMDPAEWNHQQEQVEMAFESKLARLQTLKEQASYYRTDMPPSYLVAELQNNGLTTSNEYLRLQAQRLQREDLVSNMRQFDRVVQELLKRSVIAVRDGESLSSKDVTRLLNIVNSLEIAFEESAESGIVDLNVDAQAIVNRAPDTKLFLQCQRAWESGDYNNAEMLLERFMMEYPDSLHLRHALSLLVNVYYNLGKEDESHPAVAYFLSKPDQADSKSSRSAPSSEND